MEHPVAGSLAGVFDSEPIFFTGAEEFRRWLEEHHTSATECVVGFWKAHTEKPSMLIAARLSGSMNVPPPVATTR